GLRVTAVPREQAKSEVSLPEVGLRGEGGVEGGSRLGETGRVSFDRAPPRGLERLLEVGVADPEAQASRLSGDLAARLALEQRVKLARRALPVPCLEQRASEIQSHDRGTVRRKRRFVVRDGLHVPGARVLEGDDRLACVAGLRAKLSEDVVRAPRPRPDHDEVLERTDLPTDVAALQGLRRQNEKPLLGGGSFWVGGQRCEVTLQRAS